MTPTLARMIAESERNYKKPIKWFAIPQLFRYERQQKGRLREHFQFNADILGETAAAADAELIALLIDSLRAFGLTDKDFVIRLSSRKVWEAFFNQRSQDAAKAYAFYQIIDKWEREAKAVSKSNLASLGLSFQEVQEFIERGEPGEELTALVENIAARGLGDYIKVDHHVIRGLAYYTGVVFEAFDKQGEFRAIAGGGRYDNLVKLVSGGKADLPALGFGMGDVVLLELLKKRGLLPPLRPQIDAFCIIEDEHYRSASLQLIQHLRDLGYAIEYSFTAARGDKQFKRAVELNARYTVKVEQSGDERVVRLRNLASREEKIINPPQVAEHLQ